MQNTNTQMVIMPPLSSHDRFNMINKLNKATTLASGKMSHKVTRKVLDSRTNMITGVDNFDLRPKSPRERKIVKQLCNTVGNSKMDTKERDLRVQLLVSKLNSVISKRLERTKYSAFNQVRVHSVKSHSVDRFEKDLEFFSTNTTNATGTAKDQLLRFGTGSDFKKTQSPNGEYMKAQAFNANRSASYARLANSKVKSSLHPFSTSLIGDVLRKEQLSFKNNIGLAIALTPSDSLDQSRLNTHKIDETQDENDDSDKERDDLDDYLTKRLQKVDCSYRTAKPSKTTNNDDFRTPKQQIAADDDSEYEYILESEEEEDEWNDSEVEMPSNQIFSRSFIAEEQHRKEKNPFYVETKVSKNKDGSMIQMRARKSLISENGNMIITEERKEDSYIHPALDNSHAFSNISAILGHHNFNNTNMQSVKDESFAKDCEELEFENELDDLCQNSSDKMKRRAKHAHKQSALDSVSDGEYREYEIESNVKNLKSNMAQMTKELERIRDLVMKSPESKMVLDSILSDSLQGTKKNNIKIIGDEIIDMSQYEDSCDEDNGYNSREISDLIQNRISIKTSLKNKQVSIF
jgi:hypothetical protein